MPPGADVHGFLLAGVLVGLFVSVATGVPIVYTLRLRNWDFYGKLPWRVKVFGAIWMIAVFMAGVYLSLVLSRAFGVVGTSDAAQTARMFFILIWAGMASATFLGIGAICDAKQRRKKREANESLTIHQG